MTDLTDEEVVANWQSGDAASFDEILHRFGKRVFAICFRYFNDAGDAEEAAQETFIVLHRRGASFRGQSLFSTWLYRVTTNVCHDLARKRARRPATVPIEQAVEDVSSNVSDAISAAELAADLRAALSILDVPQREAVVLKDLYGYSYERIAEHAGVAVGTVKSRVHRAHARLALHLNSEAPSGEPSIREPSGPSEHLTE